MIRLCNGVNILRDSLAQTLFTVQFLTTVFSWVVVPLDMFELDKSTEKGFLM